jgi:hypothetical protein
VRAGSTSAIPVIGRQIGARVSARGQLGLHESLFSRRKKKNKKKKQTMNYSIYDRKTKTPF